MHGSMNVKLLAVLNAKTGGSLMGITFNAGVQNVCSISSVPLSHFHDVLTKLGH